MEPPNSLCKGEIFTLLYECFEGSNIYDTICNSPSPLLAPFNPSRLCWHTTSCPPPFETQPPRCHIIQYMALISFITAQTHRESILSFFDFTFQTSPRCHILKIFKMCLLVRCFNTLIKMLRSSPQLMWNLTYVNHQNITS